MRRNPMLAALLAASMRGAQVALPSNEPKFRMPSFAKLTPRNVRRRLKVRHARKRSAQWDNTRNHKANLLDRMHRRNRETERCERQVVINKMTNWERNQWAKAGYPVEPEEFTKYARAAMHRLNPEQAVVLS